MKFKDLPEGHYIIHRVGHTVCVQLLEAPETWPSYVVADTTKVVTGGRGYRKNGETLDDREVEFKTYEDMRKERKSRGGSYSHVTRRLRQKQPLTGKTLELALDLIGEGSKSAPFDKIASKLTNGEPLDDYERHLMVDVALVHARVS